MGRERLPEAERCTLVVEAVGEQPVGFVLGLARVTAGRADRFDRGRDVVDAVGRLHSAPFDDKMLSGFVSSVRHASA